MAGVTGLEPAASGVTGRRSNQLSYTPERYPRPVRKGLRAGAHGIHGRRGVNSNPFMDSTLWRQPGASPGP